MDDVNDTKMGLGAERGRGPGFVLPPQDLNRWQREQIRGGVDQSDVNIEGDESEGSDLSDGRTVDVFVKCVDVHVPVDVGVGVGVGVDVGEVSASYYAINFFPAVKSTLTTSLKRGPRGRG